MNVIAAVAADGGLGLDGKLLFRIPEDMKRFRAMTLGKTVVCGRATLSSFPGGKPLAGRDTIVLSETLHEGDVPGARVARGLCELDALIADIAPEDVFIIGGASVYNALIDRCERAYITEVMAARLADAFFPPMRDRPGWKLEAESPVMESGGLRFVYRDYVNID